MEAGTAPAPLCLRPEKHGYGDALRSPDSLVAVVAVKQHADSAAIVQALANARNFRSFVDFDFVLDIGSAFDRLLELVDQLAVGDPGLSLSSWTADVVDLRQSPRTRAHWLSHIL
jgi:hypothetical protein